VSSGKAGNLRVLYPGMADQDVTAWQTFFQRYTRLTARYTIERLTTQATEAQAAVRTQYTYVPAGGGAQGEARLRQLISFTKTASGWRIANIRDAR
jgi:hypothetical protein